MRKLIVCWGFAMKEACDNFAKAKSLGDPSVDSLIEKHCK